MWHNDAAAGWDLLSWGGEAQWFAKRRDTGWTSGGRLWSCDQLIRSIDNAEALGWDLYLNLNPTLGRVKYASRKDVTRWRYACLDLDPPDDSNCREQIHRPIVPPTWEIGNCVFTGRGYQFWLPIFDMPEPPEWAEQAMRELLRSTCVAGWLVDPTCSDLPRRVRCPGSVNTRTGMRARVEQTATGSWAPVELERKECQVVAPVELSGETSLLNVLPHLRIRNVTALIFVTEGWEHPGRHTALYTLIKTLSEIGIDATRAYRWGCLGASMCRPKELEPREVARVVRQVYGT